MKRLLPCGLGLIGCAAAITFASPPSGVTPTLLARGSYPAFKVESEKEAGIDFEAKARLVSDPNHALDIVVRKHEYAPNSSTGWHGHPGPVFITVTKGTLHFYEYDDPTCSPVVVSGPNGSYVDTGHGHIARNQDPDEPAEDISVIIAPTDNKPFRIDEGFTAPGPYCGF
jgi:hypothetical protein